MAFTVSSQRQAGIKRTLAAFAGDSDDEEAGAGAGGAAASGAAAPAGAGAAAGRGYGGPGPASGAAAPPALAGRGSAGDYRRAGIEAAQAGDLPKALHAFGQALLHAEGEDAPLHEMRAQVLLALGRDFEAVQAAERACQLDPSFAAAWLTRARANRNLGEPQIAVECLGRLAELEPGHEALRAELPEARMLASRCAAAGGVRMHVLGGDGGGGGGGGGNEAAGAGSGEGGGGGDLGGGDGPMDGVDMTARTWAPNSAGGGGGAEDVMGEGG
ncbi:hypothetical protein Rsub_01636 [Raphidocelis subcapitata]|uniref:Uncharacterized protein n=1 Tax=Raphidocelis subcapitata TaxID=307507 RepID=A0A2V0NV86_9CHLO|nr:hypothetical protein Rsub_01636 [Raphidocelis subcapitata]|eukprot:GBF88735.1 hypothetical protein Rsub_01636 [Raphidocelis subcapitata]